MLIIKALKCNILAVGLLLFGAANVVVGQAPGLVNYQAVARSTSDGAELSNQDIYVVVKILEGGPQGSIAYQEEHPDLSTNVFGLFSLYIGGGDVLSGNFATLDWGAAQYWLEVDVDAGNGLETLGSMQFVSVPYALHAQTATHIEDADSDPTNELIESIFFNSDTGILETVESENTHTTDLSSLINIPEVDGDPTNELIESVDFDSLSGTLIITEAGAAHSADLSMLINEPDNDTDPTNELITGFSLQGTNLTISDVAAWTVSLAQLTLDNDPTNELIHDGGVTLSGAGVLSITEGGLTHEVDLSSLIDDADADPQNELIEANSLALSNSGTLSLTEAGINHSVDLSPLIDDGDWGMSDDGSTVFNTTANIGIGTTTPNTTLAIAGSVSYNYSVVASPFGIFEYIVSPTDHIIVCYASQNPLTEIRVIMPNSNQYPGREIVVRKTGGTILSNVVVEFSTPLDGSLDDVYVGSFNGRGTARFLSLGSLGWTQLSD